VQSKIGGKFHLKLNIGERPIANKYREGKMQRTLKRESKVLEIVKREAIRISHCLVFNQFGASTNATTNKPAIRGGHGRFQKISVGW